MKEMTSREEEKISLSFTEHEIFLLEKAVQTKITRTEKNIRNIERQHKQIDVTEYRRELEVYRDLLAFLDSHVPFVRKEKENE